MLAGRGVREGNIISRFMLRGRGGLMVKIAHAATTTCGHLGFK
jgi:hypothetical protein